MSIGNGNGNGAARLANSVSLLIASRIAQVIGVPLGLGFMVWLAASMIEVKNDISSLQATLTTRIATADIREAAQDRRIERVEDRLGGRP